MRGKLLGEQFLPATKTQPLLPTPTPTPPAAVILLVVVVAVVVVLAAAAVERSSASTPRHNRRQQRNQPSQCPSQQHPSQQQPSQPKNRSKNPPHFLSPLPWLEQPLATPTIQSIPFTDQRNSGGKRRHRRHPPHLSRYYRLTFQRKGSNL